MTSRVGYMRGGSGSPVLVRLSVAAGKRTGVRLRAGKAIRLADVVAGALETEIAKLRSDAADPGDEIRRKRASERLVYLEALRAAVA